MRSLAYEVGSDDRIVSVEGAWDQFAIENGAPGLTRERVLGRPLLHYVSGDAARELVMILLRRAREGAVISVPFRCDAPSRRRFLRLVVRSRADGRVRFDSRVEREEDRPPQPLFDTTLDRDGRFVVLCSWCKRVRSDSGWVEVETAAESLDLFGGASRPRLSHGICEACERSVKASAGEPERS